MSEYIICTDSGCDIAHQLLEEWGVKCVQLTFRFDDDTKEYTNLDITPAAFYQKMRDGASAKTAAANISTFRGVFEPELKAGRDVIYVGFSSGLSNTVNAAKLAAAELEEEYPDRKVYAIDTLCASAGQGFMIYLALQRKQAGASAAEVAAYVEETSKSICHWFTVDDLEYLKRGGRVSAAAAFAGGVLGIKPVLHMDDEGHLINMQKVRGRKQSIQTIVKKYAELAQDPKGGIVYISHGDCIGDAKILDDLVFQQFGVRASYIADIGPVIGAHSGPGTLALFFLGKSR